MNEKQFDNIIRNSIGQYESPVSPGMWERISPQSKKRRFFVWWWWALPGAALVTALYFLNAFDPRENKSALPVSAKENKNKPAVRVPVAPEQHVQQTGPEHIKPNNRVNVVPVIRKSSGQSIQPVSTHDNIGDGENVAQDQITSSVPSMREMRTHTIPNTASLYKKPSISLNVSFTDTASSAPPDPIMKKINPWFAEVHTGPAVAIKSIDGFIVGGGDEYSRLSMHSGILIGKYLNNRFYLKTGVTYTSIREKFEYDSLTSTKRNGYNTFDIPLIAGYTLIDQKLKINLQAGVLYNFYGWRKGFIRPDIYKKTGWRAHASVNILYPVGEKFQLMMEPYYIRQLTNMTRAHTFDLMMQQMGLSIGARYTIPSRQHH